MTSRRPDPPSRDRLLGRALNNLVARSPWLWPLVRGRMRHFFSERAAGWDERTGAGGVEHLAPLAAAVLEVSPSPERVLEVGCGTGAGTLFLAREFPQARVRGIDISEEMIERAVAKVGLDPEGRLAFRVGDAAALPYPDESFDLVAQLNMPPFFDQLARVLRPGGFVIVAASWGDATPFYTPEKLLTWKFRQRRIEPVASGDAGSGTFYVGRREQDPAAPV
ncbi:MAG: class I SAM-dependent methyltransferase [Solirubrobacterales bacterium]